MPFEKFKAGKGPDLQCEEVSMSGYMGPKSIGEPLFFSSRQAETNGATFEGEEGRGDSGF